MTQQSRTYALGESICTLTATIGGQVITLDGGSITNDDDMLGAISTDSERAKRFKSADGSRDILIQNESRSGKREITFLHGDTVDKLISWGQARIQTVFNMDYYVKYNTDTGEGSRIQRHKRCIMIDMPIPKISREDGYVKMNISFGDVAWVDPATGKEL